MSRRPDASSQPSQPSQPSPTSPPTSPSTSPPTSPSTQPTSPSTQPSTPGYTTSTSYDFSLIVSVGSGANQKEVTIRAADLDHIATNGLHFSLPDGTTITLGTLSDFISWLNNTFSISIPSTGSSLPDPIGSVFTTIVGATVTLDQFSIDQDKKDANNTYPPLRYSLTVTAKPATPASIAGILSVVGGGVGVTQTYTATAPAKT